MTYSAHIKQYGQIKQEMAKVEAMAQERNNIVLELLKHTGKEWKLIFQDGKFFFSNKEMMLNYDSVQKYLAQWQENAHGIAKEISSLIFQTGAIAKFDVDKKIFTFYIAQKEVFSILENGSLAIDMSKAQQVSLMSKVAPQLPQIAELIKKL